MNLEELKKIFKEKNISKWIIHRCSMCNYPCGYIINYEGDEVLYDNGCYCVSYHKFTQSSWEDVKKFFEDNKKDLESFTESNGFKFGDKK